MMTLIIILIFLIFIFFNFLIFKRLKNQTTDLILEIKKSAFLKSIIALKFVSKMISIISKKLEK